MPVTTSVSYPRNFVPLAQGQGCVPGVPSSKCSVVVSTGVLQEALITRWVTLMLVVGLLVLHLLCEADLQLCSGSLPSAERRGEASVAV